MRALPRTIELALQCISGQTDQTVIRTLRKSQRQRSSSDHNVH